MFYIFIFFLILFFLEKSHILLFKKIFSIVIRTNQSHQTLIQGIRLNFLSTKSTFLQFELKSLLDVTFRWMLKETIFTLIMSTRKKYDRMPFRRNHKLKTNTTYIRLNLIRYFLIYFSLLLWFVKRIIYLLDQIYRIIFYSRLNVKFLLYLLSLSLLIPYFPFLFVKTLFLVLTHALVLKKL